MNEAIEAETRWDTGCPVMDSALDALEDLQDHIDELTPHLEDHSA